jgi:hypothetical protein
VEEIQQMIVEEYKKLNKYSKEYQQRNLNVLNVNSQLLSEKRKLMDG